MKYKLDVTEYSVSAPKFESELTFAVISDLHSRQSSETEKILNALKEKKPDYILAPGDTFERLDGAEPSAKMPGFELLKEASKIAPVFCSVGNHENGGTGSWNVIKWSRIKSMPMVYDECELKKITDCGAIWLDNGYCIHGGIAFGGLSSGLINEGRAPDLSWLEEFCALDCPKVLLCHHPEYYKKHLSDLGIDLIVSGHAHGGQWRIFGRGVFAPGQGIFPKYTSGIYDNRFVISRGLKPSGHIPRIFNNPELVIVRNSCAVK